MIDVDKFVASIMKCLCMPHREDAYMCRHWINKALDAQGLKFENGKIVKNQRMVAAEAREALYTAEVETGDGGIKAVVTKEVSVESDDERIRKELINTVNLAYDCGIAITKENRDKYLAWLEKQVSPQMVADAYLRGCNDTEKKLLEKQGEKKSIWHNEDEEPQRGSLILLIMQSGTPVVAKVIEPNHTFNHGERWAYIDDLLEKQGEQKPTDKIEPKFKVGDFVVGDYCFGKVTELTNDAYLLDTGQGIPFSCEDNVHLWTIQDAKDGDVLCYKDEVLLYKHDIKDWKETSFGGIVYYCCYDGKRFITDSFYSLTEQDKIDIHPATKEQRDTLERAMTNYGYRWNKEELKLEKI